MVNGFIFVCGGCSSSIGFTGPSKSGQRFDPRNKKWIPINPMNYARTGFTLTVVNGMIYAIGGSAEDPTAVEEYDPVKDAWTLLPAKLNIGRSNHATVVVGNRLYVIGGTDSGHSILSSVEYWEIPPLDSRYNPSSSSSWVHLAEGISIPRMGHRASLASSSLPSLSLQKWML